MRVHWEKLGISGPIYDPVGQGSSDNQIAGRLNVSQGNVRRCVAWLLRFVWDDSRAELIQEAAPGPKTVKSTQERAAADSGIFDVLFLLRSNVSEFNENKEQS